MTECIHTSPNGESHQWRSISHPNLTHLLDSDLFCEPRIRNTSRAHLAKGGTKGSVITRLALDREVFSFSLLDIHTHDAIVVFLRATDLEGCIGPLRRGR